MLVERGYTSLSIEAVAGRAGIAKTTIYRWWNSKAELAIDAFLEGTGPELYLPETDSAQRDFQAQIINLATLLQGHRGRALAGMLAGSSADPTLAHALGERLLEPRRHWGLERMLQAQAAGELRPGVDPAAALSVLYGPLWAPLLFGGQVPTPGEITACLEIACAGVFEP